MAILQGLCPLDSATLYAAWKAEVGDDRLFSAAFNREQWYNQTTIPGNSSVGPSLAVLNGTLHAAWKGEYGDTDQRLFHATFDGRSWSPQIQIPGLASSVGPALGVLNGVLFAAWKGAEGDNQIYWSYLSGSTWQPQQTIPGAISLVGPSLAAFGDELWCAWRGAVKDQGLYYASFNSCAWSGPKQISKVFSSVGPSIAPFNNSLYAAWKGEEGDERIYYAIINGPWQGETQIPNASSSTGAVIATFGESLYAMWKGAGNDQSLYYAAFDGTRWSSPATMLGNTGQDEVPPPEDGLIGSTNYIFYSDGNPITGLSVTIDVTQDIICEVMTRGTGKGFGFQLNAYSQIGAKITTGWQQFCLGIHTPSSQETVFNAAINNWPFPAIPNSDLINVGAPVASLPINGLPAGYQLKISLGTDGGSNVNAATFSVTDKNGKSYSETITLLPQPPLPPLQLAHSLPAALQGPITQANLAPIVGFQLDFVGHAESRALLSSGAGTITYTASSSSPLTAVNSPPSCMNFVGTGEDANSVHGSVPAGSATTFTQVFWVAT
jgi:hypothetical protein